MVSVVAETTPDHACPPCGRIPKSEDRAIPSSGDGRQGQLGGSSMEPTTATTARADDVRALLHRWHDHGDRAARDEVAARMLPLARSLARRYANKGKPLDDLEQVACVGLIKA